MALLPEPLQRLIVALERLPGVGPKTASRLAFFLLKAPEQVSGELAEALKDLRNATGICQTCFNITLVNRPQCDICADAQRDEHIICVVEDPMDVLAIERAGAFQGKYHVLHGALSPIEGIGPENLRMRELEERVKAGNISEIIIATNPSMEGDATALYLKKQLADYSVRITRLARGLPVGGDLEYTDQTTILRALAGRQDM
ncbi:MAG: recombination protein RecR [Chloroflexi bacterium]|nr:recombination protein RecR [Chloroflexota bacterium]